jgi:hypothetical protein
MSLSDALVDLPLMLRGLRADDEAQTRRPSISGQHRSAVDSAKRLRFERRRMPEADQALDWMRRSAMEAPLSEEQRGELDGLVAELKRLVGPPVVERSEFLAAQLRRAASP